MRDITTYKMDTMTDADEEHYALDLLASSVLFQELQVELLECTDILLNTGAQACQSVVVLAIFLTESSPRHDANPSLLKKLHGIELISCLAFGRGRLLCRLRQVEFRV